MIAYETFDGAGCSSGLQLELAPGSESGYAGSFRLPAAGGKQPSAWSARARRCGAMWAASTWLTGGGGAACIGDGGLLGRS